MVRQERMGHRKGQLLIRGGECAELHVELCQGGRFIPVVWYCEEALGGQGHYPTEKR